MSSEKQIEFTKDNNPKRGSRLLKHLLSYFFLFLLTTSTTVFYAFQKNDVCPFNLVKACGRLFCAEIPVIPGITDKERTELLWFEKIIVSCLNLIDCQLSKWFHWPTVNFGKCHNIRIGQAPDIAFREKRTGCFLWWSERLHYFFDCRWRFRSRNSLFRLNIAAELPCDEYNHENNKDEYPHMDDHAEYSSFLNKYSKNA